MSTKVVCFCSMLNFTIARGAVNSAPLFLTYRKVFHVKLFFLDTETTGLKNDFHEMHQAGVIVKTPHNPPSNYDVKIRPIHPERCDIEALKIADKTIDQLEAYPENIVQFKRFISILDQYVDKFNPYDKFIIVGYNVDFDIQFLRQWFKDNDHKYYGSYFKHYKIDVYKFIEALYAINKLGDLPNAQLATVCRCLSVSIDAHDAMSDTLATYDLFYKVVEPFLSKFDLEEL